MSEKRGNWRNRYWGDQTPPKSKSDFFNAVTTLAPEGEGTVATIRMYGPIDSWGGWWGVSASEVSAVLDALPDSVTDVVLRINSPGGEVFEAVAILNLLRAHKARITAVVDGLAASAASVIAAGADETVMSPGTQMMIHSPWTIAWMCNAADLRKHAERLDGIELSLVEIYSAKAGEKDWPTLLAEETWMTAQETVEFGLADRVAVVQDQGATATVGDDDLVVLEVITDDDEDSARVSRLTGVAAAAAVNKLPSSTEPGDPNQKEALMRSDTIRAGLRERLGITDADATDETLLAALDAALADRAESTNPSAGLPAGATLIDSEVLASLQADAAAGREARAAQISARRDALVAAALQDGRIAPSNRETWRAQLDTAEETTTALLESLPKNTIPVSEVGHSDDVTTAEDAMYAKAWGADNKEGA